MRILVVGSDANACTIIERIAKCNSVDVIFSTFESERINKFASFINIQEFDISELLDFVVANEISLTVVTSVKAIENDIAGLFNDARQLIFAPCVDSANIALYRSAAKKMMYRLHIPTMKFGIFERENQAVEYVANSRRALALKEDSVLSAINPVVAPYFSVAKNQIEQFLITPDNKLIIEDYIDAKKITMYFVTDGYSALPVGSCYSAENNVISPDFYISEALEKRILQEVIYPVLDDISVRSQAYCGILGVDLLVDDDKYNIMEFYPFFRPMHLQTILPLIKTDLVDLSLSAASGSLSDEYEYIDFSDYVSVSRTEKITDNSALEETCDDNFFFVPANDRNYIFTQTARTLTRAKENLRENICFLKEKGE